MRYLNLLLVFSFEVAGIAVLGYVAYEKLDISKNLVSGVVAVLILAALGKLLWLLSKWK